MWPQTLCLCPLYTAICSADLDKIWPVASLHCKDGHRHRRIARGAMVTGGINTNDRTVEPQIDIQAMTQMHC